jgi:hypothetical protein
VPRLPCLGCSAYAASGLGLFELGAEPERLRKGGESPQKGVDEPCEHHG